MQRALLDDDLLMADVQRVTETFIARIVERGVTYDDMVEVAASGDDQAALDLFGMSEAEAEQMTAEVQSIARRVAEKRDAVELKTRRDRAPVDPPPIDPRAELNELAADMAAHAGRIGVTIATLDAVMAGDLDEQAALGLSDEEYAAAYARLEAISAALEKQRRGPRQPPPPPADPPGGCEWREVADCLSDWYVAGILGSRLPHAAIATVVWGHYRCLCRFCRNDIQDALCLGGGT